MMIPRVFLLVSALPLLLLSGASVEAYLATPRLSLSRSTTPLSSALNMAAPWFRQNLASTYAQQKQTATTVVVETVELVEALEDTTTTTIPNTKAAVQPDEATARALLTYRLQLEMAARAKEMAQEEDPEVVTAAPTKTTLSTNPVVDETTSRALLTYRLQLETAAKTFQAKVKAEQQARSLLSYRLELDKTAPEEPAGALESLECSESGGGTMNNNSRRMIPQPLSEQEERERAAKYAAIDCMEERTFTMLQDLGMIQPSLDFSI
ncbi:expressed unknown protein [Seminavis robusta]|uniref:Uncharacterized protein n=1 Tax=Seminavis robusta TaxID=568900 RepID=A0A9N8DAA4_9STRA|nr:expressed unknown protein [Seminavis robusta]|eukprot:Sro32_g021080.1 n/a (266) ;mRNA; f:149368-150165